MKTGNLGEVGVTDAPTTKKKRGKKKEQTGLGDGDQGHPYVKNRACGCRATNGVKRIREVWVIIRREWRPKWLGGGT